MTCKIKDCLINTRNPNRFICWQNGLCPKHYWGDSIQRFRT